MRTSYPKPLETMERISRQYLCDHFDAVFDTEYQRNSARKRLRKNE